MYNETLTHAILKQMIIQEIKLLITLFCTLIIIQRTPKKHGFIHAGLVFSSASSSDSPAASDVVLLASVCVKYFLGVMNYFSLFHSVSLAHPGFVVLRSAPAQNKVCRYKYHQRLQAVWLRRSVRRVLFFET